MSGSYVVCFARSKPHPYFVWVTPLLYSISCYVGLCHDDIQLFGFRKINLVMKVQLLLSKFLWGTNLTLETWAHFNMKTIFPRYGDIHYKDKTVVRLSYHDKGNPYTDKTTSLYWGDPWWCFSKMGHHFFRNGLFCFVVCSMPSHHLN